MVIQPNMRVTDIVSTWEETKTVFHRYGISVDCTQTLSEVVPFDVLEILLKDLNTAVNSSEVTCVEGG